MINNTFNNNLAFRNLWYGRSKVSGMKKTKKTNLMILTTHPIQYMAPWFRELACDANLDLNVCFLREPNAEQQGVGFGQAFKWDTPLREGYKNAVLDLPNGKRALIASLLVLRRCVADVKPDVVLITGWNEPLLALAFPLLRAMGLPVIVRGEANDLRQRGWIIRTAHRLVLKLIVAAIQIGSANQRFYLKNGLAKEQLFKGAYFVNTDHMLAMSKANQSYRPALRQIQGFDENDFVFAFVGKHVPFKRPMMVVEAASICLQKGVPVKLLFAGSGELTPALKSRANELGVKVFFTGFLNQSEMWKAYTSADAFVLPSTNSETWGLVTNEAMLFGLPVIVCDQVGCAEDLVVEGETGYSFAGQEDALATAMIRTASDRPRAVTMGLAGRKRVVSGYSMPIATAGLLAAIDYVKHVKRQDVNV